MHHSVIFSLGRSLIIWSIKLQMGSFGQIFRILYELLKLIFKNPDNTSLFNILNFVNAMMPSTWDLSLPPLPPIPGLYNILHQYCPLNPISMQTRGLCDSCQLGSFGWVCWILYELLNWSVKVQTIHPCVIFWILCSTLHQYCPLNFIITWTRG